MLLRPRSAMLALMTALLINAGVGCNGGDDTTGAGGNGGVASGPTSGPGPGSGAGTNSGSGSGSGEGGDDDIFQSGTGVTGTGTGAGGGGNCNPVLTGTVRDFKAFNGGQGHPDFENFGGSGLKGIVQPILGEDHKPVYAHPAGTSHTTGPMEFAQWYRDVEGVNMAFPFTITPVVSPNGLATYDNKAFFPIDNKGFGNQGNEHNFHFTFELHMSFVYEGGEIFSFSGDDDLWVFVNNRLAIDLGGLHESQTDTLNLDARAGELGIEKGKEYLLDFFQAERHTTASNFSIQSTLQFTNCDPIVF